MQYLTRLFVALHWLTLVVFPLFLYEAGELLSSRGVERAGQMVLIGMFWMLLAAGLRFIAEGKFSFFPWSKQKVSNDLPN